MGYQIREGDTSVPFSVRPFHPSDLCALYRICLRTGDGGDDATALYTDPELLGHYYAGPYAVLEPDLCYVLTHRGDPCGYVLGARDTAAFSARCEREWLPVLRARYPAPAPDDFSCDARVVRLLHEGYPVRAELAEYPAHLHVDLLPVAQGKGWGRLLMETFLDRLREVGVPAVHLGVGMRNERAIGFYEAVGFHLVRRYERWVALGMRLDPGGDSG